MTSLILSTCLLFFVIIISEAQGKHVDKIIIHVPYKIHKHHHTHTKYKVITIPSNKEKTIIYFKPIEKEPKQLSHHKHFQYDDMETQMTKNQVKEFIPPHQLSGIAYLEGLRQDGGKDLQIQATHPISQSQKPTDQSDNRLQSITTKPDHNQVSSFVPNYSFKPIFPYLYDDHQLKYSYKLMTPPPPPKISYLNDHTSHPSNHIYRTIIPRRPSARPSYKVREANQEDQHTQSTEQQNKYSSQLLKQMPSHKMNQRQKPNFLKSAAKHQYIKLNQNVKRPEEDNEYEHIGYLVIDGDSQKIVGKNFNEFDSWG